MQGEVQICITGYTPLIYEMDEIAHDSANPERYNRFASWLMNSPPVIRETLENPGLAADFLCQLHMLHENGRTSFHEGSDISGLNNVMECMCQGLEKALGFWHDSRLDASTSDALRSQLLASAAYILDNGSPEQCAKVKHLLTENRGRMYQTVEDFIYYGVQGFYLLLKHPASIWDQQETFRLLESSSLSGDSEMVSAVMYILSSYIARENQLPPESFAWRRRREAQGSYEMARIGQMLDLILDQFGVSYDGMLQYFKLRHPSSQVEQAVEFAESVGAIARIEEANPGICRRIAYLETYHYRSFEGYCDRVDPHAFRYREYCEKYARIGLSYPEIIAYAAMLSKDSIDRNLQDTMDAIDELEEMLPGKRICAILQQRYHIHHFARYDLSQLLKQYEQRNRTDRKRGVIIFPDSDHNNAFSQMLGNLYSLAKQLEAIDPDLAPTIYEAGDTRAFIYAINDARKHSQDRRLHFAIVAGHGDEIQRIQLGNGNLTRDGYITLKMVRNWMHPVSNVLVRNASIIFISCFTGIANGIAQEASHSRRRVIGMNKASHLEYFTTRKTPSGDLHIDANFWGNSAMTYLDGVLIHAQGKKEQVTSN